MIQEVTTSASDLPHGVAERHVDVAVIGGGPAGSTASTLIAQKGLSVALFERDHFPRFHIGESLIPETYWVFERLKMLPRMRSSPFVKKYSVQFVNQRGKLSEPFYFIEHKPHECSQTWQVRRADFDQMMLENAREQNVEVNEGARVMEVLFEGDRAIGLRVRYENGREERVLSKVVVDASGQSSLLLDRFKLREWDPVLRKSAIWTYWKGAMRDTGRDEGATVVLQTEGKNGWFWYIPQHDDVVSVGIVAGADYLFKNRNTAASKENAEEYWGEIYAQEVARCPGVQPRIANATRCAPFRVQKEYSYRSREAAGQGWVLCGDAYGFLDPLYSSGVLLALKSGQLAADAVGHAIASGDTTASTLGAWQTDYNRGMDRMRRLVVAYYDGFSFGRFIGKYPHLKGSVTDLLIGDLFDEKVDEVWEPMDEMCEELGLTLHKQTAAIST